MQRGQEVRPGGKLLRVEEDVEENVACEDARLEIRPERGEPSGVRLAGAVQEDVTENGQDLRVGGGAVQELLRAEEGFTVHFVGLAAKHLIVEAGNESLSGHENLGHHTRVGTSVRAGSRSCDGPGTSARGWRLDRRGGELRLPDLRAHWSTQMITSGWRGKDSNLDKQDQSWRKPSDELLN